jgi:putative serine protease PepD
MLSVGLATPAENLGGALVDSAGRVVGILAFPTGTATIAIPVAVARDSEVQIETTGSVVHGWLGVGGDDASDRPGGGARVGTVVDGSPAAKAGMLVNDVVTSVGPDPISSYADLVAEWRRHHPGDTLTISVRRGDQTKVFTVQLTAGPA